MPRTPPLCLFELVIWCNSTCRVGDQGDVMKPSSQRFQLFFPASPCFCFCDFLWFCWFVVLFYLQQLYFITVIWLILFIAVLSGAEFKESYVVMLIKPPFHQGYGILSFSDNCNSWPLTSGLMVNIPILRCSFPEWMKRWSPWTDLFFAEDWQAERSMINMSEHKTTVCSSWQLNQPWTSISEH